jgi:hypothetical protein
MSVTTSFQVAAEDRRHGLELLPGVLPVWFDEPSAGDVRLVRAGGRGASAVRSWTRRSTCAIDCCHGFAAGEW